MTACSSWPDNPLLNVAGLGSIGKTSEDSAQPRSAQGTVVAGTDGARTTYVRGTGRFLGTQPDGRTLAGSDERGVTLNLLNVPVPQAAKTVLGDILGVQYVVDPGLGGKITIQTPKPITKAAMIALFQSALSANGAAIIEAGGVYKIVPADQATAGGRLQIAGTPASNEQLASAVRVLQLKYVNAEEIKRILTPIAPRGGIIQTDSSRNTITLSGNPQDIASMIEAITIFDVDVMKGMSFALVPVKMSQPGLIADELKDVFASDREGPMAGMVRFLPNKRLNAILVISPQPDYLSRAESWIKRLDRQASDGEKQFYTYNVQNRRAKELVEVLQSMFSNETSGGHGGSATRNVSPAMNETTLRSKRSLSNGSRFGSPPSLSASSAQAGNGDTHHTPAFRGNGEAEKAQFKIIADEAKNAILIEATKTDYRRIMRLIETLDVMPNQVLIEATFAEITLTDDLKFGVRWYLRGGSSDFTFSDSAAGAISSVFPGFSYAIKAANIAATLNTLHQITNVNVISSPSLTVMDNKTAVLQIGDQVPITTQSAQSVTNPDAPIVNSVSYKDTGVILSMTPRINERGRVLLDIEQEVSNVVSTTTSGIDSPTIRQRRVKTSVVVNNGEAIVLGGIIQSNKTRSRTQIPLVGDIPIIGNVFKQNDDKINKTELIILITPRVIKNGEDAREITDEYRREFEEEVLRARKPRPIEQTLRRTFD